jgi:hypothetical protein
LADLYLNYKIKNCNKKFKEIFSISNL